ncbi:MAG TPA: maleylpyruvate isomerase family mycothiol-dependent enzyme [Actinocrinis sp.]|nr:maleylpyruvate isomerase family mycothiol-dependent enzyme [Actinocrinis sp.]
MELTRLRTCLEDDFRLLHSAVTAADPAAKVPSCPDWTTTDLADHVTEVYLHKTECMRLGAEPDPWPPENPDPAPDRDPVAALADSYAGLLAEFDARDPADHAGSWYKPGQNVAFWIRRMAQETVVHRVDAELAAGLEPAEIPEDLAVDGIEEILVTFVAYSSVTWLEYFADLLTAPDVRPLHLSTAGHTWSVRATTAGVLVEQLPSATTLTSSAQPATPAATVAGTPQNLFLWLWNRADDTTVDQDGDPALLAQFRALRVTSTQ